MEYAIEIENLKKDFVEGKIVTHALRGLNLKVRKGEIFGLLGPNGSGKTTTIHILSTLISPTSGTARLIGHDVMKEPQRIRALCGVCSGGASFLWDMTPKEILKYYSMLFGLKVEERNVRWRGS